MDGVGVDAVLGVVRDNVGDARVMEGVRARPLHIRYPFHTRSTGAGQRGQHARDGGCVLPARQRRVVGGGTRAHCRQRWRHAGAENRPPARSRHWSVCVICIYIHLYACAYMYKYTMHVCVCVCIYIYILCVCVCVCVQNSVASTHTAGTNR